MNAVNHVAVWTAGVLHFIIGAGWYTLLGRLWMTGIGKTQEQLLTEHGNSPLPYITALVCALVVAYTLAWILPKLGGQSAETGARMGALLALLFIGTTFAQDYSFESRPVSLWFINAGYMIVGMAVMGAIIGHWRKVK